jgi:tetratricopeptide (TPR) repeat protein
MQHFLSLGECSDAEALRMPINNLCRALKQQGSIHLVAEFSPGFSDTRVFLAEVRASPADPSAHRIVFKTGPSRLLRDEAQRFQTFISHARAHAAFARLLEPEKTLESLSHDDSLGAIAYDYAPSPLAKNECSSLAALVEECIGGKEPLEKVEDIISTVVRALASLYAGLTPEFGFQVARYYLERWAPDFTMSAQKVVHSPGSHLLTLNRFQPEYFPKEPFSIVTELRRTAESPAMQRPELRMKQLVPAHRSGNRIFLNAPHADDLCIEATIDALGASDKEQVAKASHLDIWAPAGTSRYEFYLQRLTQAFPDFDFASTTFSIGAASFHNPLQLLSQPLATLTAAEIETKVGPAHGDLHPGNVLVAGTAPVIIDYGLCEEKLPVGVDLARLFGSLVRGSFGKLPFDELVDILSEALELTPHREDREGPGYRASRLLEILSKEAGQLLGPHHSELWPYHLYGFGWIGLKWAKGTTDEYRASFLLSAVAITKIFGRPAGLGPALYKTEKQQITALPTVEVDAIKPEGLAEILVLVAQFNGRGDFDPTARIYGSLSDHVYELIPKLGRVERVLTSVVSRRDAVALASHYKASMIVWGTYDSFGVSPRYDVTRDSLVMKRVLVQLDQATRSAMGERFEPYVTQHMPEEISFLSLIVIGQMCMFNLSYSDAISVFERALTLIPNAERAAKLGVAQAYSALAALFVTTHRNKDALIAIGKARQLDPSSVVLELQELGIQVKEGITPPAEALGRCREAIIKRIPEAGDDADDLRKVVTFLDSAKSPAELVRLLKTAPPPKKKVSSRVGSPGGNKDVVFHLKKSLEKFHKGSLHSALKDIKKALRINPRSTEALIQRARLAALIGDVELARHDLKKVEKIDPAVGFIYSIRGGLFWLHDKNAPEAISAYARAYDLDYPRWPPDLDRSEALVSLGLDEDVMGELKHGAMDPAEPNIFLIRSMCYQRRGELSRALSEANQAISLWEAEPDDSTLFGSKWMYVRRGEVRSAMGDLRGAVADIQRAVNTSGEFALLQRNFQARLDAIRADANIPSVDPNLYGPASL